MSEHSGGRGRVRGFVGARSVPQKLGAVAFLGLLLTAPFGGLSSADTDGAATLKLGHRYDIGPFYATVDKVETVSDLAPAITPDPGHRLLVIEITVSNHTDDPEFLNLLTGDVGGKHTGVVPFSGDRDVRPRVFNVKDGSDVSSNYLNPGQRYQVAIVAEQIAGWDPKDFILSLNGYVKDADDPLTLDPGSWAQRLFVAEGPVDVVVKP